VSTRTPKPKAPASVSRGATTPRAALKASNSNSVRPTETEKPPANSSKSSAALREQIRLAKAARKSSTGQAPVAAQADSSLDFDIPLHDDPFNQSLKGGALVMRKRVDAARTEGKLNISAMGLKELPEEVLKMYDFEFNKTESNIAWGEVIDLTRFIAADNEIETISEECFPDIDFNEMGQNDDGNGPQFGGIEYLDLHGNLLFDIPIGLRRLERLTHLNLVSKMNSCTMMSLLTH
jgi:hypothetical protein